MLPKYIILLTYWWDVRNPTVIANPPYSYHFSEHEFEEKIQANISLWLSYGFKNPEVYHCWFRESRKLSWYCIIFGTALILTKYHKPLCSSNQKWKSIWHRLFINLIEVTNYKEIQLDIFFSPIQFNTHFWKPTWTKVVLNGIASMMKGYTPAWEGLG